MGDIDSVQAAFQEFMLGRSKTTASNVSSPQRQENHNGSHSKRKKGYRPSLRAFQGRLEEWKDTIQQLQAVMRSIANLRDRIAWESEHCESFSVTKGGHRKHRDDQLFWKDCGFRSTASGQSSLGTLRKDDIHCALNHDLLQHERMLSGLRTLTASLAASVDDIARRLDEWMLHNLMDRNEDKTMLESSKEDISLELAQQVYSLLAADLVRKQKMASDILASCHDGMVLTHKSADFSSEYLWMLDPHNIATKASKEFTSGEGPDYIMDNVNRMLELP